MRTRLSPASIPACPRWVIRKLERRAAQAPGLVEPTVKVLDAALAALDETRSQLEAALRTADFDPAELERIEERLFALRAAGRKYNVPVDELSALARKYMETSRSLTPARKSSRRWRSPLHKPRPPTASAAQALSQARGKAGAALDKGQRRTQAAQAGAAKFFTRIDSDQAAAGRMASTGRNFGADQSRTRPGPLMKVASGGELARFCSP